MQHEACRVRQRDAHEETRAETCAANGAQILLETVLHVVARGNRAVFTRTRGDNHKYR